MIFPACYIIPFYNLFAKYSDRQKESVGLMLGVTLFVTFRTTKELVHLFLAGHGHEPVCRVPLHIQ